MNSLTKKAIYFKYAMSYHLGGGTSDSEFSIINNTYPLVNTPAIKSTYYKFENSFVKLLHNAGYLTLAFHNNDSKFYNRGHSYKKMGYDNFFGLHEMNLKEKFWGATDEDLFNFVSSYIKTNNINKPYFLHIITMSSHEPFIFMDYKNDKFETIKNEKVKRYFNVIQYVDNQIKKFLETIDLNNTTVFIHGDHASGIYGNNIYKHSEYLYQNKYFEFVPLFILRNNEQAELIHNDIDTDHIISFMDISPTILVESGIEFIYKTFGEDLLSSNFSKFIKFLDDDYSRDELLEVIEESSEVLNQ